MPSSDHATRSKDLSPWVGSLARWMDSKFRVPGTSIRFGLDPVVGFIPVLGDTVTLLIGAAMLREGTRLGAPLRVHAQIIGNLLLDWLVGLIPGIDLIADTAVKAHSKNARLLAKHADDVAQNTEAPPLVRRANAAVRMQA